ncbi:MAG: phosphotransferase family protein [Acidimicrobiales bacterium]|nr:phosphotransferase family protein [Acidimicrobiales bacterium]
MSDVSPPTGQDEPVRSSRDRTVLRSQLLGWLEHRLGSAAAPEVGEVSSPSGSGMSSETLLSEASWIDDGQRRGGSFGARVEPAAEDIPVFPDYDMELQYRVLELVAGNSSVPVPPVRWLETDTSHLGARFFVMERVQGRVPTDIPTYTIEGWVMDAAPDERARMEESSVRVLSELHAIDPAAVDVSFLEFDLPGDTALRRHVANQRRYYEWMRADRTHPLIERTFAWLEDNWPTDDGQAVISWGDSRIGNIMYTGFDPCAVLDWEMVAVGPRELDLGWMIFLHEFFQGIMRMLDLPGLPEFLQPDRVASIYEAQTGYRPRDLEWYQVYAALRHAIIMSRIHDRAVRFGEQPGWPDNPDDVVPHRATLEAMMDGTFWG